MTLLGPHSNYDSLRTSWDPMQRDLHVVGPVKRISLRTVSAKLKPNIRLKSLCLALLCRMAENLNNLNGGAAAPPTDAQMFDVETNMFVCADCRKCYKTERGLNVHRRRLHEENYHSENVPAPHVKVRWDHEELVLLAREELRLTALGVRFINKELQAFMPNRTLEAIKGIRRKSSYAYHSILEALKNGTNSFVLTGNDNQNSNVAVPVNNVNVTNVNESELNEHFRSMNSEQQEHETPLWSSLLLDEIKDYKFCKDFDLRQICPGCPTEIVCGWIEEEFETWLPSCQPINRIPNPSNENRPPKTGNMKRRADFSRVQNLFRRNKSRCSQDVLNGCWSVARAQPTLADQERFWRGIFGQKSKSDVRKPEPVVPILWEIVHPIIMPELEQVIAQMKVGAPGPDGMVLGKFKLLPRE